VIEPCCGSDVGNTVLRRDEAPSPHVQAPPAPAAAARGRYDQKVVILTWDSAETPAPEPYFAARPIWTKRRRREPWAPPSCGDGVMGFEQLVRQSELPRMPRYFFDTYDGRFDLIDEEGHELPDRAAARREATRALAEMAADGLSQARSRIFRLQIRDGADSGSKPRSTTDAAKFLTTLRNHLARLEQPPVCDVGRVRAFPLCVLDPAHAARDHLWVANHPVRGP
jgi:hypothetical protein